MECCLITYFIMHNWKLCTLVSTMIWKHVLFINKERLVCPFFSCVTNICGILTGSPSKIGFLRIPREFRGKLHFFLQKSENSLLCKKWDDARTSLWEKAIEQFEYFYQNFISNFNEFHNVLIGKILQWLTWGWIVRGSLHYSIFSCIFYIPIRCMFFLEKNIFCIWLLHQDSRVWRLTSHTFDFKYLVIDFFILTKYMLHYISEIFELQLMFLHFLHLEKLS